MHQGPLGITNPENNRGQNAPAIDQKGSHGCP